MGHDQASSVVNVAGHLHEVDNVWLGRQLAFPIIGCRQSGADDRGKCVRVAENMRQRFTSKQ